ncbi:hypothetical protein [Xanthomonas populi]|uniref:hypothetical protein n=1 Tax=Xanthomonas populi TaxID=53414 RepID=UPI000FF8A054|nr:hypothetical protein [Xanthomonas populi]
MEMLKNSQGKRHLFKFWELEWMRALLERGEIRIAPASLYNDESLGPAIADDELSYDLDSENFEEDILNLHPFKNSPS